MDGRVAVITGAAGGIGGELARVVHSLGGTVVALDRNVEGLETLKTSLDGYTDNRVWTLPTQHEDLASVAATADQIKDRFGGVDLLINNAGLAYPADSIPGRSNMKSAHGMDLAFTVNYLSHFLLTEKLLSNLSDARGRIIHVTSTYHWKVNGSELLPRPDGGSPIAYESDPARQSANHVGRSYGNTKLAQIWHSRCIHRLGLSTTDLQCSSVCACPTWAATGIAGEGGRDFLEKMAFPVSGVGPGITSAINAMLRTDEELRSGDTLDDGKCIVANSRILEYLKGRETILTSKFVTETLGWRDALTDICGFILLLGQRFTYDEFIMQQSSPNSFDDVGKREEFYRWSLKEVGPWIN